MPDFTPAELNHIRMCVGMKLRKDQKELEKKPESEGPLRRQALGTSVQEKLKKVRLKSA